MKEIYEAPELNLISYVPAENLATQSIDFGNLHLGTEVQVSKGTYEGSEIGIDF